MVKIRRDNVVLHVKEEDVDRYHAMGYDVYDDKGNIVRPAKINYEEELKIAQKKIEELEAKIAELESVSKDAVPEVAETEPKSGRGRKKK